MPGWPIRKNDAAGATLVFPIYDADGDLVTAAAGLDSERSIDQGTFTDVTAEAGEIATSSGMYSLALTQAEINGDEIAVITKTSTGGAKTAVNVIYTSERNIDDLAYPATSGRSLLVETDGMIHADLKEWLAAAPNALVSSRVDASVGAMATDVLDAAALNADAVTEIRALETGTSDAGGSTTTMVDAALTELDDVHIGKWIMFTSGALLNQIRLITEFVAATDTVTFAPPVTASVGAGFTYEFLPAAAVDIQSWLGLVTGLVAPSALIAGRVDSNPGAMQNDVITAAAIAAAAITVSEAPNLDAAITSRQPSGAVAITAAAVDDIWDEDVVAAHGTADTAGLLMRALGALISQRANNPTLNALLGIADAVGRDMPEQVWLEGTRSLTALGFTLANSDFAAGAIDAAAIATDAIGAAELAADAVDEIADGVLSRDVDQVEATAPVHSLASAILKAVSRVRDNAGTLEIYRTNATTIHMSQTVTIDATLDPIDELSLGA